MGISIWNKIKDRNWSFIIQFQSKKGKRIEIQFTSQKLSGICEINISNICTLIIQVQMMELILQFNCTMAMPKDLWLPASLPLEERIIGDLNVSQIIQNYFCATYLL